MNSPSVAAPAAPQFRKLLMLSTERSGSTMLAWLLDAHPDIYCMGEVFNLFQGQAKPYNLEPSPAMHRNWAAHRHTLELMCSHCPLAEIG